MRLHIYKYPIYTISLFIKLNIDGYALALLHIAKGYPVGNQ